MVGPPADAGEHKGVVLILGPTASGKSRLAIEAAKQFDGVVINADSMQVYRDLRLITVRPSDAEMAEAPHRLFGFLDATEVCSAARWAALAMGEIGQAHRQNRLPIVIGGSGLYVRALTEGFSPIPDVGPLDRQRAQASLKKQGNEKFHALLAGHDPETAARLEPGDSQRMVRAMEVWFATGKPLSYWQSQPAVSPLGDMPAFKVVLLPERERLYERCNERFVQMIHDGAMDEIMALADRGLDTDLPLMKALGVPQLMAAARGDLLLEQAVSAAQQATRRYAKRQMTWLRHQIVADIIDDAQHLECMTANIFPKISEFWLTGS